MNPKYIRIYLIILILISIIVFTGLFIRSNKVSNQWNDMEMNGQINEFVHIGKNIFLKLDTFWFSVSYSPIIIKANPIGCRFEKESETDYYYINCPDSQIKVWSGSGGIIDDKIWLRRIDMALQKKKNQMKKNE